MDPSIPGRERPGAWLAKHVQQEVIGGLQVCMRAENITKKPIQRLVLGRQQCFEGLLKRVHNRRLLRSVATDARPSNSPTLGECRPPSLAERTRHDASHLAPTRFDFFQYDSFHSKRTMHHVRQTSPTIANEAERPHFSPHRHC